MNEHTPSQMQAYAEGLVQENNLYGCHADRIIKRSTEVSPDDQGQEFLLKLANRFSRTRKDLSEITVPKNPQAVAGAKGRLTTPSPARTPGSTSPGRSGLSKCGRR